MLRSRKGLFLSVLNSVVSAGLVTAGAVVMAMAWIALAAAPASAALITLCEDDCSVLGTIENRISGALFDFDLGLKVITEGLDFRLETDGNLFIRGPVRGDRISFFSEMIFIGTPPDPFEAMIPPRLGEIDLIGGGGVILTSGNLVFSDPAPNGSAHVEIADFGQNLQLMVLPIATSTGGAPQAQILSLILTGDVYLDVSMVSFTNLELRAKGTIGVKDFSTSTNVPEPSTAMFLGLGLMAFSTRSRRVARWLPGSESHHAYLGGREQGEAASRP